MNILEEIQSCPIEWKELGEVCEVKTGKNINKTFIQDNLGTFPVINSGKEPLGYVNVFNTQNDPIGIASRGSVGYVSWNEGRYFRGNLNYSATVQDESLLLPRFLYFYLKNTPKEIEKLCTFDGIPALNKSALEGLLIPIPPLKIQEKIVQTLDKMTEYATELTSELTSRKKQYSFYRDKLLSFEDEVYQVEWKMLGEVCEIIRGNGLQKKDFVDEGVPCIHYGQIYTYYSSYVYKTKSFISFSLSEKLKKAQTGDIIVATTSENIEDVGKSVIWLGDGEICIGGHSCIMKTKENSKYINYCMRSIFFQKQKEKQAVGTKVIELYPKNLSKIKIPIPPLEIQEKIVQILDKFDTVCNDLSIGLPKEVELRQKQYEYWRNQLLNFNK